MPPRTSPSQLGRRRARGRVRQIREGARWKENPAWLNRALGRNLEHMQAVAPPAWLPAAAHVGNAKGKKAPVTIDFQEYGCGNFGCVLPTLDPKIVMKVTTDTSEVEFVSMAMEWGWPSGITEYVGVLPLEGEYQLSKKFPPGAAAVLWRESARLVGKADAQEVLGVDAKLGGVESRVAMVLFWDLIYDAGSNAWLLLREAENPKALYEAARRERRFAESLVKKHVYGRSSDRDDTVLYIQDEVGSDAQFLAAMLELYRQVAGLLEQDTAGRDLGRALRFYLSEHAVLLGDLHRGNIGVVDRKDGPHWVITDPGNVLVLSVPW